jgi:hypothetical protein
MENEQRKQEVSATTTRIETYKSMGIRAEQALPHHLLHENTYDSNLVPDIARVDYTLGHLGSTDLQHLDGLPLFVDDLYVYGYLREQDLVHCGKRVLLSTGDTGHARTIVFSVQASVLQSIGKRHVSLSNTTRIQCDGKIANTIQKIEIEGKNKVRNMWENIWKEQPGAYFVAKVDVSEMDIEELHNGIPLLENLLHSTGYGIFCIDYTQDFSGTLVRNNLVQHLVETQNMHLQGEVGDGPTILDNTKSVGNNVVSWMDTTNGYTTRTKLYNKIVSNFEAGKVQQAFGGHLADYVECSNIHLGKTFAHPDVQARGCTRIEVSIYAYRGGIDFARGLLQDTIDTTKGANNFVVQPAPMQWTNLANELDRCCMVANEQNREIFVAWYAHSKTGKIAGVVVHPPKTSNWEKSVQWTIAEFGLRQCPIFRIDIFGTTTT